MVNKDQLAQAKVFLYELNNTRHEYGFSASEEWTLGLLTNSQKKDLEDKYYPVLSLTIAPEDIVGMLDILQQKLGKAVDHIKENLNIKKSLKEPANLLAYCTGRLKY